MEILVCQLEKSVSYHSATTEPPLEDLPAHTWTDRVYVYDSVSTTDTDIIRRNLILHELSPPEATETSENARHWGQESTLA